MPSPVPLGAHRGFVMPIGGAEDKINNQEILNRFVSLCGDDPKIVVIPTASSLPDTGPSYCEIFNDLGVEQCQWLDFPDRAACQDPELLNSIEQADGVFMTGGNQLKLSTIFGGTPVAQLLRRRNAEGMAIAGTSAGAAIMPEHMIAGGEPGATPHGEMATLAPGLGLSNKIMIDQHFRQRDRIGRLMSALAFNPYPVGLGIDEDTAALIGPDNVFEVVGSGGVTVLDPSELSHSNSARAAAGDPLCMIGLRLHVLTAGCRYDLESRQATPCQ